MNGKKKRRAWVVVLALGIVAAVATVELSVRAYEAANIPVLLKISDDSRVVSGPGPYKPGDFVEFQRSEVCNYGTGEQSTFRWIEFENGVRVGLQDNPFVDPDPTRGKPATPENPYCVFDSAVSLTVPTNAVRDGHWRFRFDTTYQANRTQKATVISYSAWFRVDGPSER